MRILLGYPVDEFHRSAIAEIAPDAELAIADGTDWTEPLCECDIFCGHVKVPVTWETVVRRGRLSWIHSTAAGVDHCLTPPVVAGPIVVTGSSGVFADAVAEQTLALTLGLLRRLPDFFRAQARHEFVRRPTRDLHGKTVGIVGFGGNGRRIAQILAPFRTRLVATDLFPVQKPAHVEALWPADRLEDLLRVVDIVILALALTPRSEGLLQAENLRYLSPEAVLINVARGRIVVERDLVEALQQGRLAGVGLDVTEEEPLPPESPLWDLPNVLITPHVGAQSEDRMARTTRLFCENLGRFLGGRPLRNLVDKALGFPRPASLDLV